MGFFISSSLLAQSYTYTAESFEGAMWATVPSSNSSIVAPTGTWTAATNNIQLSSTTTPANLPQDGSFSLIIQTKTNALITPELTSGAGVLTYWVMKTGSRTITVSTSTDKLTWSADIETYVATATWVKRTVTINDPAVKYVRFQSNSNGGLYIDNVLITQPNFTGVIQAKESKINCYPTIVKTDLFIEFPNNERGKMDINVISPNGQKLLSSTRIINSLETVDINLNNFVPGIYFLRITNEDNNTIIRKFIKR